MFTRLFFCGMCLLFSCATFGSGDQWLAGARSRAIGGASVTLTDLFSSANNQASYAFTDSLQAGIYTERRFGLNELSFLHVNIGTPLGKGTLGVNTDFFGFSSYNEKRVGIAYAKRLAPGFWLGAQVNGHQVSIENLGNHNMLTVEAGILSQLSPRLWLGAHVYNPTRPVIQEFENERSPAVFRLGLSYKDPRGLLVTAEVEKEVDENSNVKVGFEQAIFDQRFFIRAGVTSFPASISGGFGYRTNSLFFDFAFSHHQDLGGIPGLSLRYAF